MRSRPLAKEAGAPIDEPQRPRVDHAPRRTRLAAYGRRAARWAVRIGKRTQPGLGIAGSILLIAAALGYGAVAGGHVGAVVDWLQDTRDAAANALGFRIAAIALTGPKEVSREEVLTTAGVDYGVEADHYQGGIILMSVRTGAFFYVLPESLPAARDAMLRNRFRPFEA